MLKTNVMRILEEHHINYKSYEYDPELAISCTEVANILHQDPPRVFKTLVTISKNKINYVFVLPVEKELDFKKCASSVNEKSIEMIPQKDLLPKTGYVHGGCSPIGMKKSFMTVIDISARNYPTIMFSAGKRGYQVEVNIDDLLGITGAKLASITKDE